MEAVEELCVEELVVDVESVVLEIVDESDELDVRSLDVVEEDVDLRSVEVVGIFEEVLVVDVVRAALVMIDVLLVEVALVDVEGMSVGSESSPDVRGSSKLLKPLSIESNKPAIMH